MRLQWRIYLTFLACTALALALTAGFATRSLHRFYQEQVAADLQRSAGVLASELGPYLAAADRAGVDAHCKAFGGLTSARATVILPDGEVIGDSDADPVRLENHRGRPEIARALQGETGRSTRFSDTLRRTLMYLAIPVRRDGAVVAVARVSTPLAAVDWTLRSVYRQVAWAAVLVAAAFAAVAFGLARRISRPLDDMRRTAERLASGDLQARVALPDGAELQALARALNGMAAQLDQRMALIVRQSEQQKAVFASMVEGVLAVDAGARILDLNASAARLLDADPAQARGRSVLEIVRDPDLQRFVTDTLASSAPTEAQIVLYGSRDRALQLHGTALTDADGGKAGATVVLNDITRLKRLETVRQDFVANVSHELKTPITALRGCVETLAEPGRHSPADDARFRAMMARQVDRLGAIVEDLLSLSRIEHGADSHSIPLETALVAEPVRRAAQSLAAAAQAREIRVAVECPEGLTARINAPLLEQAVANLVDNAIKYSGPRTNVTVRVAERDGAIEIAVADEGPGIEKRHLDRVFERFYRVDQARSRALGGTGLGLAIVKHIALAHGGSVAVESEPGRGSTFFLRLPGPNRNLTQSSFRLNAPAV